MASPCSFWKFQDFTERALDMFSEQSVQPAIGRWKDAHSEFTGKGPGR